MERHLTIAGFPRSGTTMFYNMLRATLQEFNFQDTETPTRSSISLIGSHCTKRPNDVFDAQNFGAANVRSKRTDLILSIRDPRDILTSRHANVPDDYFSSADFTYFVPGNEPPSKRAPGLMQIYNGIGAASQLSQSRGGKVFLLRYEDLVANPVDIQNNIAAALDLKFQDSFTDFHKAHIPANLIFALNGVRPVDTNGTAKWRLPEHRDRIIDQFTRFPQLHQMLFQMGYETDTKWLEDLIMESIVQS
jgi:hypothetical protein